MKTLLSCAIAGLLLLGTAPAGAQPGAGRALAILAPSDRFTIFDEDGDVVVSLGAVPALAEGEVIVVRVDEQLVVLPDGVTRFAISDVAPGAHVIAAVIVDAELKPLSATHSLTFHVGAGSRI